MPECRLIVLLTDFGHQDGYAAILKGAIAQVNPRLSVIDLSHEIPPQDVRAGSFCLLNAYPYFPQGTVYLGVVDPGVGSQRRAIAVKCQGGYVVGPDNGLFSGIWSRFPALEAIHLNNPAYWGTVNPSTTFHGRDIFAPVAAHLASGVPLMMLGERIDPASLKVQAIAPYRCSEEGISGVIQYIDNFGNLISNIPAHALTQAPRSVLLKGQTIAYGSTYSDVTPGKAIALIGSHGWLEIGVCCGHGAQILGVEVGTPVSVVNVI